MGITLLAAVTEATGAQLDENWSLVSAQAPIPCTASGTNTIVLTQKSDVYAVTAYTNNMQFSAVAVASNNGAVTARLGSLDALNVYKDSSVGPVALVGGEIIIGCAFTLMYDAALNSGNGGFHLFSNTGVLGTTINPAAIQVGTGATLSRYLSRSASVSFSVINPNSAVEALFTLSGVLTNDAIILGPPSLTPNNPVSYVGYVSASGSVTLRAVNAATTTVTVTPAVWRVSALGGSE